MSFIFRRLHSRDAAEYRRLRLQAVEELPHAFVETVDEVRNSSDAYIRSRLMDEVFIGCFAGEALIGIAVYKAPEQQKCRHQAYVHSVYLCPAYRGRARGDGMETIACELLRALMQHARAVGVEHLVLSVESGSAASIRFYEKIGFRQYGVLPKIMKLDDGRYVDDVPYVVERWQSG